MRSVYSRTTIIQTPVIWTANYADHFENRKAINLWANLQILDTIYPYNDFMAPKISRFMAGHKN